MLRASEILLFLAPFAVALLWLVFGRRLAPLAWPALGAALVIGGLLVLLSVLNAAPRGSHYVPATLQNGRVVDGHAG